MAERHTKLQASPILHDDNDSKMAPAQALDISTTRRAENVPSLPPLSDMVAASPAPASTIEGAARTYSPSFDRDLRARHEMSALNRRNSRAESSSSGSSSLRHDFPARSISDRLPQLESRKILTTGSEQYGVPSRRVRSRSEYQNTFTMEDRRVLDNLHEDSLRISTYLREATASRLRPDEEQWNVARDVVGRIMSTMYSLAEQWQADKHSVASEGLRVSKHVDSAFTPEFSDDTKLSGQHRRYSVGDHVHLAREIKDGPVVPSHLQDHPAATTPGRHAHSPHLSSFTRPHSGFMPPRREMFAPSSSSSYDASLHRSDHGGSVDSPDAHTTSPDAIMSRRPSSMAMGAVAPAMDVTQGGPHRLMPRHGMVTSASPSQTAGLGASQAMSSGTYGTPQQRAGQRPVQPYSSDGKSGSESSSNPLYRSTSPSIDESLQPSQKYRKRSRAPGPESCLSCGTRDTPEWRRGPDGLRTLCNACGLHFSKLVRRKRQEGSGSSRHSASDAAESSSADNTPTVTIEELRESLKLP